MSAASSDFRQRLGRVETLVQILDKLPDTAAREAARELVRALLNLHTAGLAKMLELADPELVALFAEDELVGSLLLLHGIHPQPAEVRVTRALERARSRFHALGGDVELVTASEEAVRLRLRGDPASDLALRAAAGEAAIEAVPDVVTVDFEEAWDRQANGRVPLPLLQSVLGAPR